VPLSEQIEQQRLLRLELPFPVLVRAVDVADHAFEEQTVLASLSADSLSLTVGRQIQVGTKVFLVVRLSTEPVDLVPAPRVAVRGIAQRVTAQSSGTYSLAVMFSRYRFLYANRE
jgi:hypothetical protein